MLKQSKFKKRLSFQRELKVQGSIQLQKDIKELDKERKTLLELD